MKKTFAPITLALSLLLSAPALAGGADYAAPKPAPAPVVAPAQVYEPIVIPARNVADTAPAAPAQAEAAASLDNLSGAELLELAVKANDAEGLERSYYKAAVFVPNAEEQMQDTGFEVEVFYDIAGPYSLTKTYQAGEVIDLSLVLPDSAYNATPQGGVIPLPRVQADDLRSVFVTGQEGLTYAKAHPEQVTAENGGQVTWLEGDLAMTGQLLRLKLSDELGGGTNEMLLNNTGVVIAETSELEEVGLTYNIYGDKGIAEIEKSLVFLSDGTLLMGVQMLESERNPTFAPDTFEVPSE